MPKHEIVFEDLRGSPDEGVVQVDLDKEDERFGIKRLEQDDPKGKAEPDGRAGDGEEADEADAAKAKPMIGRDDDEEQGSDESDDDYSERVRKRIDRERKAKQKAAEERDYWKQKADEMSQQLAESRRVTSERTVKAIDDQISATEKALEDAIESGKTSDQVRLTSKLTDLKAERITTLLNKEDDSSTETVERNGEAGKVADKRSETNPLVTKWVKSNADWYGKRGFERQTRLANRIDREVYEDGFSPTDPDYFEELDRRLKDKVPELFDSDQPRERRPIRSPVAPLGGAEDERPIRRSGNKVEITGEDRETMIRFGLDPNDPEALREFARNKREAEADQRRYARSR